MRRARRRAGMGMAPSPHQGDARGKGAGGRGRGRQLRRAWLSPPIRHPLAERPVLGRPRVLYVQ